MVLPPRSFRIVSVILSC